MTATRYAEKVTPVRSRIAKSFIAVLLIVSIGGHWAFLQSVAWVSMVIDYSKDAPISVAVSKTFDGKHPCNLCKIVRHGQETEKKQDAIKIKTKPDVWMAAGAIALPNADLIREPFPSIALLSGSRGESPPVPPPRQA
ncbi:MAG TPA: hypothetical protein VM680_00390 [Verrucomicrobiae bacterium]|nr:hypothetical protein [Verrucomicrobiae bacterium]